MKPHRSMTFALGFLLTLALAVPSSLGAAVVLPQEEQKQGQSQQEEEKEEPQTEAEKASQKEIEARACNPEKVKHSAETDKKQHPTPDAPPDKALMYVIRPTMGGNKIQTKLAVDKQWMGVNRGNNYFFFTLEPGTHYFCSQAENKSVMALKVEAGRTYYLQQKIRMGFMKARNKLVLLDAEEGKKGLAKCHLSISEVKK